MNFPLHFFTAARHVSLYGELFSDAAAEWTADLRRRSLWLGISVLAVVALIVMFSVYIVLASYRTGFWPYLPWVFALVLITVSITCAWFASRANLRRPHRQLLLREWQADVELLRELRARYAR